MKRTAIIIILILSVAGTVSPQAEPPFASLPESHGAYPAAPSATSPSYSSPEYSAPSDNIFLPFSSRERQTLQDDFLPPDEDDDGDLLPAPLPVKEGIEIVLLWVLRWGGYLWVKR
ncbi:MAG: hypothetical protein LBK22_00755 [Tannerella sp.]|jgi:hypothetical protein|nr:hypothetical protein [Tannerella sp.]